MANPDMTS